MTFRINFLPPVRTADAPALSLEQDRMAQRFLKRARDASDPTALDGVKACDWDGLEGWHYYKPSDAERRFAYHPIRIVFRVVQDEIVVLCVRPREDVYQQARCRLQGAYAAWTP